MLSGYALYQMFALCATRNESKNRGSEMGDFIDLSGKRHFSLTILRLHIERASDGRMLWVCKCDCGNEVIVRGDYIRAGKKKSCGCRRKGEGAPNFQHGMTGTPEFKAWKAIKSRCGNPNHKHYRHYGGRGIRLWDGWEHDFPAFFAHVGTRPSPRHTIDRIDNAKGYEPDNVRWALPMEQSANRRSTVLVQFRGDWIALSEVARLIGEPHIAVWEWAFRGKVLHGTELFGVEPIIKRGDGGEVDRPRNKKTYASYKRTGRWSNYQGRRDEPTALSQEPSP